MPRTPKPMQKTLALCAALAMTAAPMAAFAAGDVEVEARSYGETVTYTVSTDGADTEEGAKAVYAKLKMKAEVACKRDIPRDLGRRVNEKRCQKQLMKGFVKELDHEKITALHKES